ncbi:MAG: STAS-like domain-containing protein [Pyrinomonadaceae bacterium]
MTTMTLTDTSISISVSGNFARVPGPRFEWQGKSSGEEFLKTMLMPKFLEAEKKGLQLIVDLDGTEGYSTGFLDGSFGELARDLGFERVMGRLQFITNDEPYLETEIISYMKPK